MRFTALGRQGELERERCGPRRWRGTTGARREAACVTKKERRNGGKGHSVVRIDENGRFPHFTETINHAEVVAPSS